MSHTGIQYVILDAARLDEKMEEATKLNSYSLPLLNAKEEVYVQKLSAFLFSFQSVGDFANLIVKEGWGQSWGIYVSTNMSLSDLREHLSKNKYAKTEAGEIMYFRFYDPRVLRIFLPTCDLEQLREFFGPIRQFIVEDEDSQFALIFSLDLNGVLKRERVQAGQIFDQLNTFNDLAQISHSVENDRKDPPTPKRKWYFLDE